MTLYQQGVVLRGVMERELINVKATKTSGGGGHRARQSVIKFPYRDCNISSFNYTK